MPSYTSCSTKARTCRPGPEVVERSERFGSGQQYVDPFDSPHLDMLSYSLGLTPDSQSLPSGSGTSQILSVPGFGFSSFQYSILQPTGFRGFGHHLLRAQLVHQCHISLYRRHPRLTKRRGRLTWTAIRLSASGIVLGRKSCDLGHPTGLSSDISKEGIHILVEFEPIEQQNILITHDRNTTTLPEHITAVSQMVSDEPSMMYSAVNNDDDEVDGSDGDEAVSSQSKSDDDNDSEEGEFQTPPNPVNPVNPVTGNTMQQWESSQWFSNARYDYTQSGAFLDMGSGSPIDDIIESGTVRLLDWNDSMTDV
ncbi:hypothetical protein M9H77_06640 [Catharanthus roseus]|uniref:Uncharacterized protein n=1 Tax=Catharanthus roseus TaxID=4058 RepID=A0ACC0BST6_CATRO|nr:hypothetical protein M9H77_06640 [Catharanthus roseus]